MSDAPETRVAYHRRCNSCDYDLIGLPREGSCPECGLPIIESMGGRAFLDASPDYYKRLRSGTVLLDVGFTLYPLLMCWWPTATIALLVPSLGMWKIAARPPESLASMPDRIDRLADLARATRIRILFGWGAGVLAIGLALAPIPPSNLLRWSIALAVLAGLYLAFGLGFALCEQIAVHMPHRKIRRTFARVRWMFPIWCLVASGNLLLIPMSQRAAWSGMGGWIVPLLVVGLGVHVPIMVATERLRRAF